MNRSQQSVAIAVVAIGLIIVGLGAAVLIDELRDERQARKRLEQESAQFEKNMLGVWKGQTGCAGDFRFRADGTYELVAHGPGASDTAGGWKVRWDTLPPTLVLTCETSSWSEELGKTKEVKLLRLDDRNLAVDHSGAELASGGVARYARVK